MKLSKVILLLFYFNCLSASAQELIKVDEADKTKPIFYIGLNETSDLETLKDKFKLHTVIEGITSKRAIISTYTLTEIDGRKAICLQPNYALNAKVDYRLKLDRDTLPYVIQPDKIEKTSTEILSVYPMSDELPANVLTFYIEFDKPMRPDTKAFTKIALIKEDGNEIEDVWRHRAVWQNNNTVLALMIHPGRIKKGIVSTDDLESIFIPGQNIQLQIKDGLFTQKGNLVEGRLVKTYTIGTEVRKKVNKKIEIQDAPLPKSKEALTIEFNSQMDFGLVNKWVTVTKDDAQVIGTLFSKNDHEWEFYPNDIWQSGKYEMTINCQIGDPAHNNMNRLFEEETVKSFEKEERQNKQISLHFTIK